MSIERHFFRILRPDEEISDIRAKDTTQELYRGDGVRQSIEMHIKSGSSGYRSPWISATAELNVALAFSSVILRVAKMTEENLQNEKEDEVIVLDNGYLCTILSEEDVMLRSKRSDEVLIFKRIKCAEMLSKEIKKVKRTLHSEFSKIDEGIFPEITSNSVIEALDTLAGPNKGLFRVKIDGKNWLARLPRPNYDLEKNVLFGKNLVRLCQHQFVIMSLYRSLGAPVPKCALYTFDVMVEKLDGGDNKSKYRTALLLFEDMQPCSNHEDAERVAQDMFPMDLLLGNWDPIEGVKEATELISPSTGAFFITKDGKTVRLSVDRAMGCIYPEDRAKSDKHIVEFDCASLGLLRKTLQNAYPWCYGRISETNFIQTTINMINNCKWEKVKEVLEITTGLPWMKDETKNKYLNILDKRKKQLYNEVAPVRGMLPGRHGSVADNNKEMGFIGINSIASRVRDLWKFDETISYFNLDISYMGVVLESMVE